MLVYLPEKMTVAERVVRITMRKEEEGWQIAVFHEHDNYIPLALLPETFTDKEAQEAIRAVAKAVGKAEGRVVEIDSASLKQEFEEAS